MSKESTQAAEIESMDYEQAREELASVVTELEAGGASLEKSLSLWERGEALAQHCEKWLEGARSRIEKARAEQGGADSSSSDSSSSDISSSTTD